MLKELVVDFAELAGMTEKQVYKMFIKVLVGAGLTLWGIRLICEFMTWVAHF